MSDQAIIPACSRVTSTKGVKLKIYMQFPLEHLSNLNGMVSLCLVMAGFVLRIEARFLSIFEKLTLNLFLPVTFELCIECLCIFVRLFNRMSAVDFSVRLYFLVKKSVYVVNIIILV